MVYKASTYQNLWLSTFLLTIQETQEHDAPAEITDMWVHVSDSVSGYRRREERYLGNPDIPLVERIYRYAIRSLHKAVVRML